MGRVRQEENKKRMRTVERRRRKRLKEKKLNKVSSRIVASPLMPFALFKLQNEYKIYIF